MLVHLEKLFHQAYGGLMLSALMLIGIGPK
ncbi:Uncharacterised protein [Serratia entomophila]|nr:Uncharacterised protein [Serratia entomophila]CAI1610060.1 Uncharacterised protein [Serratia entomophila]CAI1618424.1 Uncharacterised protein [Serratia entomophila]CAI1701298.1 Uncharacterised protein [Serratia entomophila]CAI1728395.1 Uncharacterised protein [Serratia entomophila]